MFEAYYVISRQIIQVLLDIYTCTCSMKGNILEYTKHFRPLIHHTPRCNRYLTLMSWYFLFHIFAKSTFGGDIEIDRPVHVTFDLHVHVYMCVCVD